MPPNVYHMAPAHWYTGFKDTLLEIIIHAENIDLSEISMEEYEGVRFLEKSNSGNRHIAYITLNIQPNAKPGILQFQAKPTVRRMRYVRPFKFSYELKGRSNNQLKSINQKDILYRVIVDRFCNGDEGNDNGGVKYKTKVNRSEALERHGGDLKGLAGKAEYFTSLGVSAIWFTAVQESDHPEMSFTGLSTSDHFMVDSRLGSMDMLIRMIQDFRSKGLKTMMDINPNDISTSHWMYQNFDTGWFNAWDTLIHPDFTSYSIKDPYYSPGERLRALNSWFDRNSPDLNHRNAHIRRYLDQAYLWWIEKTGISGICVNRVAFFSSWYLEHLIGYIKNEYPDILITTDTKTNSAAAQASMVKNYIRGFETNGLESIPDYHVHRALRDILDRDIDLQEAVSALYMAMSDDILYLNPAMNLTFIDNSLEVRASQHAGGDMERWQLATVLLLTLRGIPVIYYGTEVMLRSENPEVNPAMVDFPGGWKGDKLNLFGEKDRGRPDVKYAYQMLQRLITFRSANSVLTHGEMMQYPVEKGIYVFFRYDKKNSVLIICNTNREAVTVDFGRFAERTSGFNSWTDILNKNTGFLSDPLELPPQMSTVLKLY